MKPRTLREVVTAAKALRVLLGGNVDGVTIPMNGAPIRRWWGYQPDELASLLGMKSYRPPGLGNAHLWEWHFRPPTGWRRYKRGWFEGEGEMRPCRLNRRCSEYVRLNMGQTVADLRAELDPTEQARIEALVSGLQLVGRAGISRRPR
jgi:hypothetical protein